MELESAPEGGRQRGDLNLALSCMPATCFKFSQFCLLRLHLAAKRFDRPLLLQDQRFQLANLGCDVLPGDGILSIGRCRSETEEETQRETDSKNKCH